jgi:hypothetical protein
VSLRIGCDQGRLVSRLLSGYLCGTHSGLLALSAPGRRLRAYRADTIASAHEQVRSRKGGQEFDVGERVWQPDEQRQLADALRSLLGVSGIFDLIFYGSQARGHRTGFSDVDAILVIGDEIADSATRLRALRPSVLAAQRAVLAYQPMQHHGFEVASPRLLRQADEALGLPAVALSETASLRGTLVSASLAGTRASASRLNQAATSLGRLRTWPVHPWEVHRHVAMFELLPALYLQARGTSVSKARSFEEARSGFGDDWWPYDVLADVRRLWPRMRWPPLEWSAAALRNPWVAVAAWRRLPATLPAPIRPLLTPKLLEGLQSLAASMLERVR